MKNLNSLDSKINKRKTDIAKEKVLEFYKNFQANVLRNYKDLWKFISKINSSKNIITLDYNRIKLINVCNVVNLLYDNYSNLFMIKKDQITVSHFLFISNKTKTLFNDSF